MRHLIFAAIVLFSRFAIAQEPNLQFLLNQLEDRINQHMDYESFSAHVVSISSSLDKEWNPQKRVIVDKQVLFEEDIQKEIIIKAVEIKNGNEKDVTQKFRDKEIKRRRKVEKNKLKSNNSEEDEKSESLNIKELFPFSEVNKDNFNFFLKPDTIIDDQTYHCLQTEAKEKSKKLYEGIYLIDRENYHVVMFEVSLSKNPSCVKDLRIKINFDLVEEKYLVPTHFWMRVYADIWIKKIRREEEVQYTNYQFRDQML